MVGYGRIGPWAAQTITGSWSTNTTYTAISRRVGGSLEVQLEIALAGAPTAANLSLNPPQTFDEAIAVGTQFFFCGHGIIRDSGTAERGGAHIIYDEGSDLFLVYYMNAATTIIPVTATAPQTFAVNDTLNLRFSYPVSGW